MAAQHSHREQGRDVDGRREILGFLEQPAYVTASWISFIGRFWPGSRPRAERRSLGC